MDLDSDEEQLEVADFTSLSWGYQVEKYMYGVAFIIGIFACFYTVRRFARTCRTNLSIAARLISYKISLSVADSLILFLYAPTQFLWIHTFWWYGGDYYCRGYKFLSTFAFHLTGNMQVLIAVDRLYITTRINQVNAVKRKVEYNSNLYLAIAWLFAFTCALPQLFIFRRGYSQQGDPQCISAWTEARFAHDEQKQYAEVYEHFQRLVGEQSPKVMFPNGTLRVADMSPPEMTADQVEDQYYKMLVLEQIYNIFHLASICVLPYVIELLCYAGILYLLKGAKRGQFMGFSDLFKCKAIACGGCSGMCAACGGCCTSEACMRCRKGDWNCDWCHCFRVLNSPEVSSPMSRFPHVLMDPLSDSYTIRTKGEHTYSETGDESTPRCVDGKKFISDQPRPTMLSLYTSNNTRASFANIPSNLSPPSKKQSRRASAPPTDSLLKPWINTVNVARRNTRRKAFYMLTLNLIFWGPYCMLGIISAITVFEGFQQFQFVCALVVFNAITNLIL